MPTHRRCRKIAIPASNSDPRAVASRPAVGYKAAMLLYAPESVYVLDRTAMEHDCLPPEELMQRAGEATWRAIVERWPDLARVSVLAGAGNNGGDAFVVALAARRDGVDVQLLTRGDLAKQSDTSRHFADAWRAAGGAVESWSGQALTGDVIVDGLLGIGLQRDLDPDWQASIEAINAAAVPKVAIDIPSGLNASTGLAQPVAVAADLTVTFIGAKTGQYLADGPDYCGELRYESLGVSARTRASVEPALRVIERAELPPPRRRNTHKNHYGHVLIVGGDEGMSGAVALAARAALRAGAGLVTALVHPDCRSSLAPFPEVMTLGWDALATKLAQASIVLVGPGLGDGKAARRCLDALIESELPMVVDAGALRADFLRRRKSRVVVITPHPGEAAALLEADASAIQADRLTAAERLRDDFGAVAVLKGAGTLVAAAGEATAINIRGNAGLATAGTGDVLAGVIAALLGQGLAPAAAARGGVFLHALSAERFTRGRDPAGLVAGDLIDRLPLVMRQQRHAG